MTHAHRLRRWLGAITVVAFSAAPAAAQDRRVIQNRTYTMNHELTAELGALPLDVLYKAPTLSLRYTWHINDYVAWEALSLTYAPTTDLSMFGLGFGPLQFNHFSAQGNELKDNFGYRPFDIDQVRLIAESNVVLTPLYGKFSLFNRSNARLELYALGGFAVANFIAWNPWPPDPIAALLSGQTPALPAAPLDFVPQGGQTLMFRPGVDIGGGARLFVSKRVSFRIDTRGYGFLEGYRCVAEFGGINIPIAGVPALPACPDASPNRRDSSGRLLPQTPRDLPTSPLGFTPALYVGMGLSVTLGGGS